MKRRDFIKKLAAVSVAGTTAITGASAAPSPMEQDAVNTMSEATEGTSNETTLATAAEAELETGVLAGEEAISVADIAAADRIAGRTYTAPQHEQMARQLGPLRQNIQTLRKGTTDPVLGPAVHFDPRLPGMTLPKGNANQPDHRPVRVSSPHRPLADLAHDPEKLAFATVSELSQLIRSGRVTSMQLTRLYLDRLKKYGPRLLCTVNLTEELALEQAQRADQELVSGHYRGPLHGIPWGAKDLLATKRYPTTWGAKPYEHQVFDYDSTVTERLAEAGAVLVAKLTMGELAMGDHWFGGVTRNPWNPAIGSSGSSAGPGSATAAGLVGFAIGTETLGSIVSPSVRNGVIGLRPTFGRVSRYGAMPLSWTMDKIGPMCRSAEDCALVFNAIYGPDGKDVTVPDIPFQWNPTSSLKKLRVGIDKKVFDQLQTQARTDNAPANLKARSVAYDAAIQALVKLGVELIPISLPGDVDLYSPIAWITIDAEGAAAFDKLSESGKLDELAQQGDSSWPNTFRIGSTIPASDYIQAMRLRTRLQQEMAKSLEGIDCFVTIPFAGPNLVYTNLTGHPTLITRCGVVNGVPLSIEFVGNLYREDAILRLGHAFERATGHYLQWPDLSHLPETPPELKSRD